MSKNDTLKRIRSSRWLPPILLVVISAVVHFRWFALSAIFTYGDWWFKFNPAVKAAYALNLWQPFELFGRDSAAANFAPLGFLTTFITPTQYWYIYWEKIVFFFPLIIIAPLASYYLIRRYVPKWPAVLGSLIYTYNTYFIVRQADHLNIAMGYALAPALILAFMIFLESRSRQKQIFAGSIFIILLLASSIYEIRVTYITVVILVLYSLYALATRQIKFKPLIIPAILLGGFSLLISAYWLQSIASSFSSGTVAQLTSRPVFESFQTILNGFTLSYSAWTGAKPAAFTRQTILPYFYLLPLLFVAGMYFCRKNKAAIFWGGIGLLGVFLVKGSNIPFTGVYGLLFNYVPGFKLFRESSKFYLLTTLAYSILIPMFITWLAAEFKARHSRLSMAAIVASVGTVLVVAIAGSLPIITGGFEALTTARIIPSSYIELNKTIYADTSTFRTLWLPQFSRWSYYDNDHSRINASDVVTLLDKASIFQLTDSITFNKVMSEGLVKYAVVPIRDVSNDDDFVRYYTNDSSLLRQTLDQSNIFSLYKVVDGAAVYINKSIAKYADVAQPVFEIPDTRLDDSNTLLNALFGNNYEFTTSINVPGARQVTALLQDAFSNEKNSALPSEAVNVSSPSTVYQKTNLNSVTYSADTSSMSGNVDNADDILLDGKAATQKLHQAVNFNYPLSRDLNYYLAVGNSLIRVQQDGKQRNLINLTDNGSLFSSDSANIFPNGDFEASNGTPAITDCNAYDNVTNISAKYDKAYANAGQTSLELSAATHTACYLAGTIGVTQGSNLHVAIDYSINGSSTAGYRFTFNDQNKTSVLQPLQSADTSWNTYQRLVSVPAGATTMSIELYGYSNSSAATRANKVVNTHYDNLVVSALTKEQDLPVQSAVAYEPLAALAVGQHELALPTAQTTSENLIPNPSLESGLWQPQVGDCNNFDEEPDIAMKQNSAQKTEGTYSLELSASRHTACTGPGSIDVSQTAQYVLSFDYQTTPGVSGSAYVNFNDVNGTANTYRLPASTKKDVWQHYSTVISVPLGASHMNLLVYGHPGINSQTAHTYYDNFILRKVPLTADAYYLIQNPTNVAATNKNTDIHLTSSGVSEKGIAALHVTSDFTLKMSEGYSSGWRLGIKNSKPNIVDKVFGWTMTSTVPESQHIKLNDFENGWYINVHQMCVVDNECIKQSDGTYDIDFVAEYKPQRGFEVGLVISAVALIIVLDVLIFFGLRMYLHRKDQKRNDGEPTSAPSPKEVAQRVVKKAKRIVKL